MLPKRCGTITLKDPGVTWAVPYSCHTVACLLRELLKHNFRSIQRRVLVSMGFDMKSRRRKGNLIYSQDDPGRALDAFEMRNPSKGMVMELLSALVFTCLDDPVEVTSWCQLSDAKEPKSFAASGSADITVDYGNYVLVVEVSSKTAVSGRNFRTQIEQAIDKAEKAMKTYPPGTDIFAVVINEGSLERGVRYRRVYAELEPKARASENIRLVPIWAKDFAEIAVTLSDPEREVGLNFQAEALEAALRLVYERIAPDPLTGNEANWLEEGEMIDDKVTDPGWMRATILAVLEGQPTPDDIAREEEEERERIRRLAEGPSP